MLCASVVVWRALIIVEWQGRVAETPGHCIGSSELLPELHSLWILLKDCIQKRFNLLMVALLVDQPYFEAEQVVLPQYCEGFCCSRWSCLKSLEVHRLSSRVAL